LRIDQKQKEKIMARPTLEQLKVALEQSWSRETTYFPDRWSAASPSTGQGAVTALVVQDYLGGEILRTMFNGQSYYLNELPDGSEVNLTAAQFRADAVFTTPARSTREHVLGTPATVARYKLLKERVVVALES
jgi:hypothetical protein